MNLFLGFGSARALGGVVVVLYSLIITGSDVLIKMISQFFPPAQLFSVSCLTVVGLSLISAHVGCRRNIGGVVAKLSTKYPVLMALRCLIGLCGAFACFHGFRLLSLAEMFMFFGMIPLVVAPLSCSILGERLGPASWGAMVLGVLGVCSVFFDGELRLSTGNLYGASACVLAALSLVVARWMTQREGGCLAQVFWPNLGIGIAMLIWLPFVMEPMSIQDFALAFVYGGAMFAARWLCMMSLKLLPAHVATPMMNIQFVWALVAGSLFFGDVLENSVVLGGALIVGSSLVLLYQPRNAIAPRRALHLTVT
ncbi:DMT family transporter [Shimia sp. NS0008-38b]|uniref:DMT family transporter n=1 Tax=Shimia sp. NS0008-38b TaxID=3127653 RepID=UPI00333FEDBF